MAQMRNPAPVWSVERGRCSLHPGGIRWRGFCRGRKHWGRVV